MGDERFDAEVRRCPMDECDAVLDETELWDDCPNCGASVHERARARRG